jgi:hypothetical protein
MVISCVEHPHYNIVSAIFKPNIGLFRYPHSRSTPQETELTRLLLPPGKGRAALRHHLTTPKISLLFIHP